MREGERERGREMERERERERGRERIVIFIFERNDGCLGTFLLSSISIKDYLRELIAS